MQPPLSFAERQHKRTTSSVLKSIMASRNQPRDQPTVMLPFDMNRENSNLNSPVALGKGSMLPPNHPHARQQLRDESRNRENTKPPPVKPVEVYEDRSQAFAFHKKSKSTVSLKSLMGTEKANPPKPRSPKKEDTEKPKKSKSSTNLSALLSRPKSSKDLRSEMSRSQKDKENMAPSSTAEVVAPPIWAQFAKQPSRDSAFARKVPLNDVQDVDNEMALYTPLEYSPSKQRNFHDYEKPTLCRRGEPKPRPRSAFIPSGISAASFTETLSGLRKQSHERGESRSSNQSEYRPNSAETGRKASSEDQRSRRRDDVENRKSRDDSSTSASTLAKRGSRVMAVVAALNGKSKEPTKEVVATKIDIVAIESAFENLLDSRNVPQNTRDKMRALDTNIKADFVKQDRTGSESTSCADGLSSENSNAQLPQRPVPGRRSKTEDSFVAANVEKVERSIVAETSRKSRPRSRTFTLSKGESSPSKKQKPDRPTSRARPKSDDFISYLSKVQKPESVEVGKLHKLRQLLRNETVSWVDAFITRGGMAEIVGLLNRIIQVEWREDHEDALLHETLLCLKALCTTSLALHELSTIQSTLFPTLLAMLFDAEKKGPSEFTTRNIIISLLFTYLSASTSTDLTTRARTLLSYLRDPSQPEAAQPPGFIASMHHPRPYRIWCKEIVNVTKEVFWIFLHHLNIIPYPSTPDPSAANYASIHFPRDRPPVPAAPYVGGVEWDATNYVASHLDLLNGIVAALPSREERNSLRQELSDSGFEKCMGGTLRTCKEKFYGSVHAGLSTWIGAASEDGWDMRFVKEGPRREEAMARTSPKKGKREEPPPKLEMPRLDLDVRNGRVELDDGGWL